MQQIFSFAMLVLALNMHTESCSAKHGMKENENHTKVLAWSVIEIFALNSV